MSERGDWQVKADGDYKRNLYAVTMQADPVLGDDFLAFTDGQDRVVARFRRSSVLSVIRLEVAEPHQQQQAEAAAWPGN